MVDSSLPAQGRGFGATARRDAWWTELIPVILLLGSFSVKRKLPSMYHQFNELADVDITKGPMEVGGAK